MDWVLPGALLAGKYTLERKLGQGGMGAVWRAEHGHLRSPVAIKLIDEAIARHPEALGRFMREAQAAAALRSPHVVQILDYGADRGVPYIAMELLEGESLADRLARAGRLPPAEVARVITELARAIGRAHELSIVHRDLKPDNVFLVRNDDVEVTKVLDFGIAKASQTLGTVSGNTRTGAVLGTPHYMSPEQAEGTKFVDHRTDLWALGVIAFECLVGRRPFESDALGGLLLAICTRPLPVPSAYGLELAGFDAWFAKACAREVAGRFQSARELASDLRRVIAQAGNGVTLLSDDPRGALAATTPMQTPFVTVPATAGVPSASVTPAPRKHGVPLALGGVVAVAAVAGLAMALHHPTPATTDAAASSTPSAALRPPPERESVTATSRNVAATSPSVAATSPKVTATSRNVAATSPSVAATSPKVAATSPKVAVTSNIAATSPSVAVPPSVAATSPKIAVTPSVSAPLVVPLATGAHATAGASGRSTPPLVRATPTRPRTTPRHVEQAPRSTATATPSTTPPQVNLGI
jgi:serine/threonine-protein kinase